MEIEIIKFFQSYRSLFYDVFFGVFSYLASYIGFIILLLVFFHYNKKYSLVFAVNYGFIVLVNSIIKNIVNRPRPYIVDDAITSVITAVGSSFPSGHMTSATILATFTVFLIYKMSNNKTTKILSTICAIMYLIIVALSRMYFGQHFITDCIFGFLISFCLCLVSIFISCKTNKKLFKNKE